jgi:hypothetical protein
MGRRLAALFGTGNAYRLSKDFLVDVSISWSSLIVLVKPSFGFAIMAETIIDYPCFGDYLKLDLILSIRTYVS